MPAQASSTDASSGASEVVLTISLAPIERLRVRQMLQERIHGEWEIAEDLKALGRSYEEPLARAALCVRMDAALEAATTAAPSTEI